SLTGIPNTNRLLLYLTLPGALFMDNVAMVPGTVPANGTNLLVNGNFETPLNFTTPGPGWKLQGTNGTNTATSAAARQTGNLGLDLRFSPGGGATQFFYQDIANIDTGAVHTLSFWYLPSPTAVVLEMRMSASFRATINVRAPADQTIVTTPGTNSAIQYPVPPYPLLWLNEVLPLNT